MNEESQQQNKGPATTPPPFPVSASVAKVPQSKFTFPGVCAFAGGAVCLVLALFIVVERPRAFGFHRRDHGLGHFRELRAFKLPEQLPQARSLCTPQGFAILSQLSGSGVNILAAFTPTAIETNLGFTDARMVLKTAEGKSVLWVRMVNRDGWKLDDVYIDTVKGCDIHWWASSAMEHPVAFMAACHADDIKAGVKAANSFLDTTSKFLSVISQLKALDQNSRSQRD
jgi:hypothetical protein